jgi:peroxin-16
LTWLVPDRFAQNELSLEAIHTAINLISAYHDTLINDPGPLAPNGAGQLIFALAALQQVEVLVELWAKYNEQRGALASQYEPLILVEGLKAIVRLSIYRVSKCRLLTNGGTTAFDFGQSRLLIPCSKGREVKAKEIFAAFSSFRVRYTSARSSETEDKDTISKEEVDREAKSKFWWEDRESSDTQVALLLDKCRKDEDKSLLKEELLKCLEREALISQSHASKLVIAGELLHILRPVVYVLALRRWGRQSWIPWSISLSLEIASSRLTSTGAKASQNAAKQASCDPALTGTALSVLFAMQGIHWRRDEADELTRRKLLMLFSLLRDPFFARFTRPAIKRWQGRITKLPLLGGIFDKALEVLVGLQKYYTYTAAS